YEDRWIQTASHWKIPRGQYSALQTYVLIDTVAAQQRELLNVPLSSNGWEVAWAPDNTSLAIAGTYLPLDNGEDDAGDPRRKRTYTVEVEISSGRLTEISSKTLNRI